MLQQKDNQLVIIVHGWASTPHRGWIDWLRKELQNQGYSVVAPVLPNPRRPNIEEWLKCIESVRGEAQNLILVGHSLGVFALLHFINQLPSNISVNKFIMVAGFFTREGSTYWKEHLLANKDFVQIKKRIKKSYCIYSTNDRVVEPEISRQLAFLLASELIPQPKMGHFSNLRLEKLPIVLDCISE